MASVIPRDEETTLVSCESPLQPPKSWLSPAAISLLAPPEAEQVVRDITSSSRWYNVSSENALIPKLAKTARLNNSEIGSTDFIAVNMQQMSNDFNLKYSEMFREQMKFCDEEERHVPYGDDIL
ncbi:hypothetical protein SESBI_12067 [Sesbania bispinosa]|nr:hypothetical protein SESBI_12067 [Sesbania bispinosa]